ncbi:hypothetical protein [Pedobacter sp. GR22-6]|uniref:hypothetical protein n=1 Tax=Pedobacter sp. GR22-6 TaxID=3127957 RepID=UPI00307CF5BF
MDILYSVDEKYLQAMEELRYGELPKALHFFNTIIELDPDYARAYYQLGSCYYYQFRNYQTAGYYYKKCIDLEPLFPDVYVHYLKLLITLKMHKAIDATVQKALAVPGISETEVYELLGNYAEQQLDFDAAKAHYQKASLASSDQDEHASFQGHVKRIAQKEHSRKKMVYAYQG